jgi:hypothetical protein
MQWNWPLVFILLLFHTQELDLHLVFHHDTFQHVGAFKGGDKKCVRDFGNGLLSPKKAGGHAQRRSRTWP